MDWTGEAAAARKRLAAAGRAPDGAYAPTPTKTVQESLCEVSQKYSGETAKSEVLTTSQRPEYGRSNTGRIFYPNRPVEPDLGAFWVDYHGQETVKIQPRVRAALGQHPENSPERAAWLAKLRANEDAREQDANEHIQKQNAFRKRFAKREGKWKGSMPMSTLERHWRGEEEPACRVLRVRSFY